MRTGQLAPAEDDLHGWRGQIAWGVPRVLLGAGLIAVVLSSIWNVRQRNWVELAAVLGLCTGVLISYSWRRVPRCSRAGQDRQRVFTSAVLDSVPGLLYLYDAEGRLVRWNKKHEEITGYSAEELAQMHVTDWFRGDDVGYIAARVKQALADGCSDAEAALVTRDGTTIPFYFTGVRLILDGKRYLAGIGIDITPWKAAEEALQRERIFTGAVLDSVPGLPYMFDAEGRLVRWNKKQVEMTGYSAEELAQIRLTDWFRGEEVAYIAARMEKVFTDGYSDAEANLIRKDGTAIPFYFTGVRLILDGKNYLAGMGIDISRRKAAEEAIRKSEMLYRTLFQSANDAIFIIKNDVFSDCNPMATRVFGYPREELIGHSPAEFSPRGNATAAIPRKWRRRRCGQHSRENRSASVGPTNARTARW